MLYVYDGPASMMGSPKKLRYKARMRREEEKAMQREMDEEMEKLNKKASTLAIL